MTLNSFRYQLVYDVRDKDGTLLAHAAEVLPDGATPPEFRLGDPWRVTLPDGQPIRGDVRDVTVISIGSHGFSVLELCGEQQTYRENSRCSQGTGNFLRQLVERFELTIEQASVDAHILIDIERTVRCIRGNDLA